MTDSLFDRLSSVRVLVVGDIMLDRYLWGDVRRISPEAPVPVVEIRETTHVPGGAANAAVGVTALGASCELISAIGDDSDGKELLRGLRERLVECDGVLTMADRVTTTKTRVIAHNQQVVRADIERLDPPSAEFEAMLLERSLAGVTTADVVLLSDYAKGMMTDSIVSSIIAAAQQQRKPVVVDPKGRDYMKYRGATVLTPNVHDLEQAVRHPVETQKEIVAVARSLSETLDGTALLITRGAAGMTLVSANKVVTVRAEAKDVYDVTGAGDTVVALLAAALACDVSLEAAVRIANTAAGIVVGKIGTAFVTIDELRAAGATSER